MSRLAAIEGVSRPAASGIVSRLVERGLVERRAHPHDGRSALAELTGEGREVLERGRRERTAALAVQLALLSEEERRLLAAAIPVFDRLVGEE